MVNNEGITTKFIQQRSRVIIIENWILYFDICVFKKCNRRYDKKKTTEHIKLILSGSMDLKYQNSVYKTDFLLSYSIKGFFSFLFFFPIFLWYQRDEIKFTFLYSFFRLNRVHMVSVQRPFEGIPTKKIYKTDGKIQSLKCKRKCSVSSITYQTP